MRGVEASVVVPLSLEETWDFIFDDPRRAASNSSLRWLQSKTLRCETTEHPDTGW